MTEEVYWTTERLRGFIPNRNRVGMKKEIRHLRRTYFSIEMARRFVALQRACGEWTLNGEDMFPVMERVIRLAEKGMSGEPKVVRDAQVTIR
jgi:hypothetical protein